MTNLKEQLAELMKLEYMKDVKDASAKELYNVVGKMIMLNINDDWKKTQHSKKKKCGYLSAEFLIGRLVYANLLNTKMLEGVKEALNSYGIDINEFEEVEDAALGNGGLGRLAACFLESAATKNVLLDGYGLRYKFGLFKQSFVSGFQNEEADDWLKWGDPFSVRNENDQVIVHFEDMDVLAVPYDMPVIGYDSKTVNTLRLWSSEPVKSFDFKLFDEMKGETKAIENNKALEITSVLYPNDNTLEGKILRLRQEYFMVSASLQDSLKKFKETGKMLDELPSYQIWQLNDTHPTLAIPEMLRLLKLEGLTFKHSLKIAKKMFNFTNHTIMAEALEQWSVDLLEQYIPDVLEQIILLQKDLEENLDKDTYYIIKNDYVNMAYLAIYVSSHVNGVAKIHTDILKKTTFHEWYQVYKEKFVNVTNGVTPRRWLVLNNPSLTKLLIECIGDDFITNLNKLSDFKEFINDEHALKEFKKTRKINKEILAAYILKHEGIEIDPNFLFDIQIKRLHEYKRQLLNALSILYIYNQLKDNKLEDFKPTVFIFGAKSAPGYYMAKAIIKLINTIAELVNNDKDTNDKLKVVFVSNYNVSYAERLVCGADISEQISLAGMEASGTGNMKFMINGTPTLGTLDGANVEIAQCAGRENNYIFGMTVDEVDELKPNYNPKDYLENNSELNRVVEMLVDGSLDDDGSGVFEAIHYNLINEDRYMVLADFNSYIETKLGANKDYDTKEYYKKCIANTASCGEFSSDRSILDYNRLIWNL